MAKKQSKYTAPARRDKQKNAAHPPVAKKAARPVPQPQKQPAAPTAIDTAAAENLRRLRAVISDARPTVAVVGGGAAGLAAAITAARYAPAGVRVVLLEKAARVGRKLLATGNGRCNLSNRELSAADYVSGDRPALETMLAGHCSADTVEWFASLGLVCTAEDGRIYPHCQQASAVLDVLRLAADAAGVITLCGCAVSNIREIPGTLTLQMENSCETLQVDRVILAVGGAAAPALGGSAEGYGIARQLGHSCTALVPGLAAVQCRLEAVPAGDAASAKSADLLPGLKGIRALAAVTLYDGAVPVATEAGEVQFAEGALSGIPVLQHSLLLPGFAAPRFVLDLLPDMPQQQIAALLAARRAMPGLTLEELLLGTVHKKLGHALLKAAGFAPLSRPAATLTDGELDTIAAMLKGFSVSITGVRGWEGAQTTVGGVPLCEVAPDTCCSRKCAGLYLAGEVLDAAGRCGGYNLDWAFATGRRAGKAAALSLA